MRTVTSYSSRAANIPVPFPSTFSLTITSKHTPSTGHSRSPSAHLSIRRPIDLMTYPVSTCADREVVLLKICHHPSVASINVLIDDHIHKGTPSTGHSRNQHDTRLDDLVDRVKSGRVRLSNSIECMKVGMCGYARVSRLLRANASAMPSTSAASQCFSSLEIIWQQRVMQA